MRTNLTLVLLLFSLAASAQTFTRFDLNPGPADSQPDNFTVVGDKLYFTASDSATGKELWVTDGSSGGTHMVKDIAPGPGSSTGYPRSLINLNGQLFFVANENANAFTGDLWVSDGTPNGTHIFKKIGTGPSNGVIVNNGLYLFNNKIYFFVKQNSGMSLWSSDGTVAGTDSLTGSNTFLTTPILGIAATSDKLYFQTNDGTSANQPQLWCTDGTPAGTYMLYKPGSKYCSGYFIIPLGNKVFYTACDSTHGPQLWVSDGTDTGTHIAVDPNSGKLDAANYCVDAYNGNIFFSGSKNNRSGFFRTDGTTAGTDLLIPLTTKFTPFTFYNGQPYFWGTDSLNHTDLYVTDGTTAGTRMVKDKNGQSIFEGTMANYNNYLYIIAHPNRIFEGLYKTNGTDTGTSLILKSPPGHYYSSIYYKSSAEYKGALWMAGAFDLDGIELWSIYDTVATSIHQPTTTALSIYPNPNNGNFTINTGNPSFDGMATVYDITGRVIISKAIHGATHTLQLPIAAKGIYLIKLQSGDAVSTRKILVE